MSGIYLLWILAWRAVLLLSYLQFFVDSLLGSLLVYYTGGVDSTFANIYVLIILSAGFIVSPGASFYIAVLCTACFMGSVILDYFHWYPGLFFISGPSFSNEYESIYIFYASYVHITVFFLVAFLIFKRSSRLPLKYFLSQRTEMAFTPDFS